MKHVHADEMIEFAKFCIDNGYGTSKFVSQTTLDLFTESRIDPYRELKEAQDRGEVIQYRRLYDCNWKDGFAGIPKGCDANLIFDDNTEYRIKPKTVKLYLWAMKVNGYGNFWTRARGYYETEAEVATQHRGNTDFKRIDSTMIEV